MFKIEQSIIIYVYLVVAGPKVFATALPWLNDPEDSHCYSHITGRGGAAGYTVPSYYIPIPAYVDTLTKERMLRRFADTGAHWWGQVCNVVRSKLSNENSNTIDVDFAEKLREKMCSDLGSFVSRELNIEDQQVTAAKVVNAACIQLFNAFYQPCRALQEYTDLRYSEIVPADVSESSHLSSSLLSNDQQRLSKILTLFTSLQEPRVSESQTLNVVIYHSCPASKPGKSLPVTMSLQHDPDRDASLDVGLNDSIHVSCEGHPDILNYRLKHSYVGIDRLDSSKGIVKHWFQVCATCASENQVKITIENDKMCCKDKCNRDMEVCAQSLPQGKNPYNETDKLEDQWGVSCTKDLLSSAESFISPVSTSCLGECSSLLKIRFQLLGTQGQKFIDQSLYCDEKNLTDCHKVFGGSQ